MPMPIPPNVPMSPGQILRIYKNEIIPGPYLQVIGVRMMENDNANQPRWK